jgi:C4-dicarboxylate-specific signal transduction histidine kinase
MEVHIAPIADASGTVVGLRGFALEASRWTRVRDELARTQEQLAQASRRATLNELVASLVHEINQPLNAILNNAQAARIALDRSNVQASDIAAMLDEIVSANERAGNIIRRARGLANGGDHERKPVDLGSIVGEACELLASHALLRNAVVTAHPAAVRCLVAGDPVQLLQVVMNLATNALDAVAASPVGRRNVDLTVVAAPGDFAWIVVTDSGPGIAPSMLDRMFEPLLSTKADGLGLGLDIASSIVRRHGGSMWAANNRDAGAHVVIGLALTKRSSDAVCGDR